MRASLQDLKKDVKNTRQMLLEELVGRDVVQAMLQSREVAERYIDHPEAKYRCVAIATITDHWNADEQFAATCERLATADDDVNVRMAAITTLGKYYDSTGNRRIGQMLARMVQAASYPEILRHSAYEALWQLARGGDSLTTWRLLAPAPMQFPGDVDWSLISHFLSG
jgi:hypothetical protein